MNPRNPLPSLDLLKGFEVVARHLSFTKAAVELCVTQSAVSRQIRQLEEHLGVRLFERRTRAVVLTEIGYRYYTELTPLLRQLGELTQRIAATHTDSSIRVTTTLTVASLWLVPRLAAFQEKHPQVQVHVVADNLMRDLARDGFDVAIRYGTSADAGAGALKLFDETLTAVCSPELAAREGLKRLDDLDKFVLIHYNDLEGRAPWLSWDFYFAETKHLAVRAKGAVYFSHYDQAIRAARAGQGVALGRLPVIDSSIDDGGLVAPLPASSVVSLTDRAYWLIVPDLRQVRPEVEIFSAWLRSEAARSAMPRSKKRARH